MNKVRNIERQVEGLSPDELAEFRHWFAEFDADAWDRQFEADAAAGKLDRLGETALAAHAAARTTKL